MLLECDRQGLVIWLSDRTRFALGVPENLAQVLQLSGHGSHSGLRWFEVLRASEGLLLAGESENPAAPAERRDPAGLQHLEGKLLNRYFRLQSIERSLARRAARKGHGGGRLAIRQIELERQRVGRELHTGVGQMLAAIRLQLEVVASLLAAPPDPVRQALENIAALASGALNQVRSVSQRLHPPEWQRLTIETALRQLWEMSGIPLKFQARLELQTLDREPEPEVKALIYRTAQEGLSNIIGHSKAKAVSLSLQQSGDLLVLRLEDDGVGFDLHAMARAPVTVAGGIGLRSIEEQAAAVGAKMEVATGSSGTKIVLSAHFSVES